MAAAVLTGACASNPSPGVFADASIAQAPNGSGAGREGQAAAGPLESLPGQRNVIHVVDLVFDVVRLDFPLDKVRHARKVWNHVDELRMDPSLAAHLKRNGLRAGAASSDAWAALRTIVEASGGQVRRDQIPAQRGLPLVIRLGSIDSPEAVFRYAANGRAVGKTFEAGDKLVVVDYAYHPRMGGATELLATLEIRHDRGVMTWERHGGIIREVPAFDRFVFEDMQISLTLSAEEFLVIGMSDKAEHSYLVGSRFLTTRRGGEAYESVLCLTPRPVRLEAAGRESR